MHLPTLSVIAFAGLSMWTPTAVPLNPVVDVAIPTPDVVDRAFDQTIHSVESMVHNAHAQQLARRHGLSLVNVSWEDTGRYKGSSVGPNISDMTIGVRDAQGLLHPMPVLRFDNFSDKTADLKTQDFFVLTGNERDKELRATSLHSLLSDTREYLHNPRSWKGRKGSLLASDRDSHVLVSAQAAFLPIPKSGAATFTPVIYNYQSSPGNPAVLTIVATREGTSVQVVENDSGYMSEALFFNANGERAPFTAMRLTDFQRQGGDATTSASGATADAGLDTVLVIQVPLKHAAPKRMQMQEYSMAPMSKSAMDDFDQESSVEQAVIGHGAVEGPFTELHNLEIERDPRFPVRVTVQFYKATSSGNITDADVRQVRKQIDRVYDQGDWVGSLVTAGHTTRPTEWTHPKPSENAVWARPWGVHLTP
ncbi:MAG: hypothetical protein AB8H79_05245 [Myxococcota bacterium]